MAGAEVERSSAAVGGFFAGAFASVLGLLVVMLVLVPFASEVGSDVNWWLLILLLIRTGILLFLKANAIEHEGRPRFAAGFRLGVAVESTIDVLAVALTIAGRLSL